MGWFKKVTRYAKKGLGVTTNVISGKYLRSGLSKAADAIKPPSIKFAPEPAPTSTLTEPVAPPAAPPGPASAGAPMGKGPLLLAVGGIGLAAWLLLRRRK